MAELGCALGHCPGSQLGAGLAWPLSALPSCQARDWPEWEMPLIHACSAGKPLYSLTRSCLRLLHELRAKGCRQTGEVRRCLCTWAAGIQSGGAGIRRGTHQRGDDHGLANFSLPGELAAWSVQLTGAPDVPEQTKPAFVKGWP